MNKVCPRVSLILPKLRKIARLGVALFGWAGLALLSGCETPGQSALAGAGTGAVVGGMLKGTGRGMAQGAAIGAAGGYVLGAYGQSERARGYAQATGAYAAPAPPPPVYPQGYYAPVPATPRYHQHRYYPSPRVETILYGRHSGRYGFVYSPYGRGSLVDVRGFPRGAQVVDPFCGRIFLNP
jgi:hypothetical protein